MIAPIDTQPPTKSNSSPSWFNPPELAQKEVPRIGSGRRYELILLPMHPAYRPTTAEYQFLSSVIGELEFSAWAALETHYDWPGFYHDCERALEMMDEGVDDRDPVDVQERNHRHQIWQTVEFQYQLKLFYDRTSEIFFQYLGPSIHEYYFAYESHRPGAIVLTAWKKTAPPPHILLKGP